MRPAPIKPVVLVSCCRTMHGDQAFHSVGEKYLTALTDAAGCLPFSLPALKDSTDTPEGRLDVAAALDRTDGALVTGSPSNLRPERYGGAPPPEGYHDDPARDATTLPLIRTAIDRGQPLLAICRGAQELNAALGGTLHTAVHEQPDRIDHREPKDAGLDLRYGARHAITWRRSGPIGAIIAAAGIIDDRIDVNSLHGQGVDRLADPLQAEAEAEDGTVEALAMPSARGFVLGLQWHPEYRAAESPFGRALFGAFGAACRRWAESRTPVTVETAVSLWQAQSN